MTVRDLVQKFESSEPEPFTNRSIPCNPEITINPRSSSPNQDAEAIHEGLPRKARFIKHRAALISTSQFRPPSGPLPFDPQEVSPTLPTQLHASAQISTSSLLADSETTTIKASGSQSSTLIPYPTSSSFTTHSNVRDLLADLSTVDAFHEEHTYPPDAWPLYHMDFSHNSSSRRNLSRSGRRSRKPVPAPALFSRKAYPLSLPMLDDYIASLPSPFLGEDKDTHRGMFPPMDALSKTGRSLEDLETNSVVAPAWRNRVSIAGGSINALIGLLGSSALASFYSLQGLINTVQVFALILSTIVPVGSMRNIEDQWRQLFLGTIPNVLALNFAPIIVQSLLFLVLFMAIGGALLYSFYKSTARCGHYSSVEGLQSIESKDVQWSIIIVSFLLLVLYLPLSTMSVHVLVWSQELWAVPNPYTNATTFPPVVPPLGPSNVYRDPLDFCWTTTMKRNEVNYAPIVVVLSAIVFFSFAVWFPIKLHNVIKQSVPKVDGFTELGRPRSRVDMDGEYQRLLNRDRSPFSFLYNGFRRGWGTYYSIYLFAKLSTLVITAVIDPDNCLFRSFSRTTVPIVRQSLLLASTFYFFIAQCSFTPFLNPVNNASEWTSRLNYMSTAATALLVTLDIPGKDVINTYVLYCIYVVTYGLGLYFLCIDLNWSQRLVKRLSRRIDFSIDIFSPRLDISSSSIHTKRRIWQEAITTLLLTDLQCKIPTEQAMIFSTARDSEFPPYLLDFMGTPGERHVENLKILREVGSIGYYRAVSLTSGPDSAWYRSLVSVIQKNFIGPDSYWKKSDRSPNFEQSDYFGNAWWIPFPPTLVLRYDRGSLAVLKEASDLQEYIAQNSRVEILRRRYVRMSLRALEGKIVRWPYDHIRRVGSSSRFWCCGSRYSAVTSVRYEYALLTIRRHGHLLWQGLQLGSGFDIELKYSKDITTSGEVIGLTKDYDLTSPLARFLEINRDLIDENLGLIEEKLDHYRKYHRKTYRWKAHTMTYRFLSVVYDNPSDYRAIAQACLDFERDPRVHDLILSNEAVFRSAHARLSAVSKSEAATWWYIFWDDLWRRNYDTISALQTYATDFCPYYTSSIAYTPLPRPALETFLTQRGMLHSNPRFFDFFTAGFLNKLYLRLNDAVFRDSGQAVMFHLGNDKRELDMEDIDILTQGQSSTLGTGGGTDHNDSWIRTRPTYRWEGLLSDPPRMSSDRLWSLWQAKLGAWMGLTPLWRFGMPSDGLSLDVEVKNGRYILFDDFRNSEGD